MKLLIVDDEELTRNGLVQSLDWAGMGIDEIYTADDGVNGLETAQKNHPDIVLCDVRMPRLNGIEMLAKMQTILPDIVAIFMSGYSDKEYLMSAIKMGAINYIEKPISEKELESAIHKAIEQSMRHKRESIAADINANTVADSLAYYLTMPYNTCKDSVDNLALQFMSHYGSNKFINVCTIIVKLAGASEASSELPYIYQSLRGKLAGCHLHIIFTEKRLLHLVYHVYSDRAISDSTIQQVCNYMKEAFNDLGDYHIAIGNTVNGISKVYHSYESAVILLQKSFFFESGTVTSVLSSSPDYSHKLPQIIIDFHQSLSVDNQENCMDALSRLYKACLHSTTLLPNQIKTEYFNLFTSLYQRRHERQLMSDMSLENNDNIMDIMDSCFSYIDLHKLLEEKVTQYFEDIKSNVSENKTIYLIKNYINTNYSNPNLSVKDISDYAHLSVSYLCTFFKNETGNTLNQYITEFRMDRAKQLLVDPRNKVSEISERVGYNDGNYFGKSFKKIVGLSPSEYREKAMK